jgi:signal transduction histidine kinase
MTAAPAAGTVGGVPGPRLLSALAVTWLALLLLEATGDHAKGLDGLGVAATVLAVAPVVLVAWTSWPAVLLSALGVFALLETTGVYQAIALPSMTVGYVVVQRLDRERGPLLLGAFFVAVVLSSIAAYSPHGIVKFDTAKNLLFVAVPLLAGCIARDRRELLAALVARAETAEREREEEARRRVGEERLRIAREVHDVVAHAMVGINVQAGVAAHLVDRDPGQAHAALREIKRTSGEALADLRATLGVLRDDGEAAPTAPAHGLAALGELTDSVRAAGVAVALDVTGDARPLPSAIEAAGYRIVQEALTNVLRHAGARHAGVTVAVGERAVDIEVVDDGTGGPVADRDGLGSGNGLRGMRERAAAVGGRVEAGARQEGGWRVVARLPIPA